VKIILVKSVTREG